MTFAAPFWSPAQASAILFDWDGVIAETKLDFSGIRKKYYGGRRAMLLEDSATLPKDVRDSLMRDLEELEMEGAYRSHPVPGILDVLRWVECRNIPWAVVSRNCRKSIAAAANTTGVDLPPVVRSRDDGDAVKPHPKALLETCGELGVNPSETLFIGDFIYDMIGARRTGMRGVLVKSDIEPDWEPWLECSYSNMGELFAEINDPSEIIPWEYQETASKRGKDFLKKVHALTLHVPMNATPDIGAWILKAASVGAGSFLLPERPLDPALWKKNPLFDTSCIGLGLHEAASSLLKTRFPFAKASASDAAPAIDAPCDSLLLEEYMADLVRSQ